MVQRLAAVAVSVWDHTQKYVECDWKKALAGERADLNETPVGPITEPTTESQESAPTAQQEPACLHHPVLLRRCQHETLRTRRWIHQWSWDHKNAENAKERGQARRQQVKSLEDQW